jgi:hypothetical protein
MKIKRNREYEENGMFEISDGTNSPIMIGSICHLKNGMKHNIEGPAIILNNIRSFYLWDMYYSEKEWKIEVERLQKNGKNFLK